MARLGRFGFGVEQAEEARDCGGPRIDAELRVHVLQMFPDRAGREEKQLRDLRVPLAASDPGEHLALTRCQAPRVVPLHEDRIVWALGVYEASASASSRPRKRATAAVRVLTPSLA
jgi:hypothetical protein